MNPTLPLFADAPSPPPPGRGARGGALPSGPRAAPLPRPADRPGLQRPVDPPVGGPVDPPVDPPVDARADPPVHPSPAPLPLEHVHPALWRAHQLGHGQAAGQPTGFAALDAELPGGGWPPRALTELLLPHPGIGELRLLAPALVALQRQGRCVMLVDPPAQLCPWAWQALGGALDTLVLVQRRGRDRDRARALLAAPDMLWSLEQALASGHLGAVVGWLPARLPPDALRRLQLAAQAHDGPAFLLRDAAAARQPSPAPLRLVLGPAPAWPDDPRSPAALAAADALDTLQVRLLKRRGPPARAPLRLALAPVLSAPERARAPRRAPAGPAADRRLAAQGRAVGAGRPLSSAVD